MISGMALPQRTAQNLASSIRIGSLSLELEEIRSNVVGAQLGEEAISTSLTAGADRSDYHNHFHDLCIQDPCRIWQALLWFSIRGLDTGLL